MNLKKFNEIMDLALNEELPLNVDLDQMIINELKEWQTDLLDEVSTDLEENEKAAAEQAGYKCYGGDGYHNNALVIDVKGRPDVDANVIGVENDAEFWDELDAQIAIFADILREDFKGFTIRGRMGGYWGLEDLDHNLVISEHGFEAMKNRVIELLNDPELYYKDDLRDAQNEQDLAGLLYDVIYGNKLEIANALVEQDDTIEIKPEFLEEMNELSARIDAQEEEMKKPEFWQREDEE